MLVSIITVVYNNEAFIEQCLNSVLSQKGVKIQYIVIDGQSTDGTLDIIEKYEQQIDYFISEADAGLYDALNKGISQAKGDIVGILNSDDYYEDEYVLNKVVNKFKEENCDMLHGNMRYVERKNTDKVLRIWRTGPFYSKYFRDGHVPGHQTVFLKHEIARKFEYDLRYPLAADYDYMLKVFHDGNPKVGYIDEFMINMRLGGVTSKNWKNVFRQNIEIATSWWRNQKILPLITLLYKRPKLKLKQFQ